MLLVLSKAWVGAGGAQRQSRGVRLVFRGMRPSYSLAAEPGGRHELPHVPVIWVENDSEQQFSARDGLGHGGSESSKAHRSLSSLLRRESA